MERNRRILLAKAAVGLAVLPVLIHAYATGPDARHSGAPGDQTCAISGCHLGTALNGGGGSVQLTSSNGTAYTPGQTQTFTITVTDSKAKVYGFQMSARVDSNGSAGQAGDFTPGAQQIVICDDNTLKGANGCPANTGVQFIEHSNPFRTNTISVQWMAPVTNVGTVTVFVAANAANGDGTSNGDHIYTTKLQLSPLSPSGNKPSVAAVVSAGAFNAKAGVAVGTWLEIYGSNLGTTNRGWSGSDFNGNNAPTSLDGVSVTIGGKAAYVDFVSSGQVNVQVPDGIPLGAGVPVVLTNSQGESNVLSVQTASLAPSLLAPPAWLISGKQYVVGQFTNQNFVGRTGMIPGVTLRPAKAGDVVTMYGIGFGPVTPTTAAGVIDTQTTALTNKPAFLVDQTPAQVLYAGLAPGFVGLYQFNIMVPNISSGDHQLHVTVGGTTVNQTLFITTQ